MNLLFWIFIILASHHHVRAASLDEDIQDFINEVSVNTSLLSARLQERSDRVKDFFKKHDWFNDMERYENKMSTIVSSEVDFESCLETRSNLLEQLIHKQAGAEFNMNLICTDKVYRIYNSYSKLMIKAIELKNEINKNDRNIFGHMKFWAHSIPSIRQEGERVTEDATNALNQVDKCIDDNENIIVATEKELNDLVSDWINCMDKRTSSPEVPTSDVQDDSSTTPNPA